MLSEAHYPGWRARIGDNLVPVRRVNLAHQGVEVPAGQHRVVFEFAPFSLYAGAFLSLASLLAVVALVSGVGRSMGSTPRSNDKVRPT